MNYIQNFIRIFLKDISCKIFVVLCKKSSYIHGQTIVQGNAELQKVVEMSQNQPNTDISNKPYCITYRW